MTIMEAMDARHSVRQYQNKPIDADVLSELRAEIDTCNKASGLHIQLVINEPKAFDGFMAHYGKFSGVTSYIAMVGQKSAALDETCGYWGERIALKAQQLGLNTCWVAMTYKKIPGAFDVKVDEKPAIVIALGYGLSQGTAHLSKKADAVSKAVGSAPAWFASGVKAALLAPTAMNQQKFMLTYSDGKVEAKAGLGFYAKIDLGIVKYHFEIGAGKENVHWRE